LGIRGSYKLQVSFDYCEDAPILSTTSSSQLGFLMKQIIDDPALTTQKESPVASIKSMAVDGTIQITFNATLKPFKNSNNQLRSLSKDEPFDIKSIQIMIGQNVYPALEIKVIAGKNSDPAMLGLNWTLVSFTP
jgi:hypothetical protein